MMIASGMSLWSFYEAELWFFWDNWIQMTDTYVGIWIYFRCLLKSTLFWIADVDLIPNNGKLFIGWIGRQFELNFNFIWRSE